MKVLKFYAEWCSPCKTLSETIKDADVKYDVIGVDIDKDNVMATKYGIRGIPMCILIDDEGKEVRRKAGMMTKEQFEQFVNG